jgi:hypothetical protein
MDLKACRHCNAFFVGALSEAVCDDCRPSPAVVPLTGMVYDTKRLVDDARTSFERLVQDAIDDLCPDDAESYFERYPGLVALRDDPAQIMVRAGLSPDPWQRDLLAAEAQYLLVLAGRQSGKSTAAAAVVIKEALFRPQSLVLLCAPSTRQSGELFLKVKHYYDALHRPVPARKETELQLHLVNGSRVIALPESERTVQGYSGVRLIVLDEAAMVDDALYYSVRPMLAVSKGRLLAISKAFGRRGWFFESWENGSSCDAEKAEGWHKVKITADDCARITPAFLAEERRNMGERLFLQEYYAVFHDQVNSVFRWDDIRAAMTCELPALPAAPGMWG